MHKVNINLLVKKKKTNKKPWNFLLLLGKVELWLNLTELNQLILRNLTKWSPVDRDGNAAAVEGFNGDVFGAAVVQLHFLTGCVEDVQHLQIESHQIFQSRIS